MANSATKKRARSKKASLEDYATQEYEAWPADVGTTGPLSSLSAWLKSAEEVSPTIAVALQVMKRDHLGNAEVATKACVDREGTEPLQAFMESLYEVSQRYAGLARTLEAAHVRAMAGMARHLRATEEL